MHPAKRYLLIALTFALALTVFATFAPRVAHAITAALVQIVNTPTTAVPAVQAPAAAQLYRYNCFGPFNNTTAATCDFPQVPAGHTLFIEAFSAQVIADPGTGPYKVELITVEESLEAEWLPMVQQPSTATSYNVFAGVSAARISVPSSVTPACSAYLNGNGRNGYATCSVQGYLVPAQ